MNSLLKPMCVCGEFGGVCVMCVLCVCYHSLACVGVYRQPCGDLLCCQSG